MRVLIIEDNRDIAASIYEYLEDAGYTMDAAGDGVTGLHLAVTNDYDVIILDLGLPGIDGVDLCRCLRKNAQRATPVIMLTARDSLETKLEGFDSGADDYLVKPFALQELAARVKVLSQRVRHDFIPRLQVGDLTLDLDAHEVYRAGKNITLNPTLFRILTLSLSEITSIVSTVLRSVVCHLKFLENPLATYVKVSDTGEQGSD